MNGWVSVSDRTQVALEMAHVNRIEANLSTQGHSKKEMFVRRTYDGHEEANVSFCQPIADKVILPFQDLFDLV